VVNPEEPTRDEVKQMLLDLIAGRRTPEEVADWASAKMAALESVHVRDLELWHLITTLSGADLMTEPGVYLHSELDYRDWLHRLDVE
jgi:hypothetical protein